MNPWPSRATSARRATGARRTSRTSPRTTSPRRIRTRTSATSGTRPRTRTWRTRGPSGGPSSTCEAGITRWMCTTRWVSWFRVSLRFRARAHKTTSVFVSTRAKIHPQTVQNLTPRETKPFPEYSASRDGPTERRPGRLLLRRHDRRAGLTRARHPGHPLGPPAVHARAVPREAGLRVQELRQPRDRRRAPGRGVHARARGWRGRRARVRRRVRRVFRGGARLRDLRDRRVRRPTNPRRSRADEREVLPIRAQHARGALQLRALPAAEPGVGHEQERRVRHEREPDRALERGDAARDDRARPRRRRRRRPAAGPAAARARARARATAAATAAATTTTRRRRIWTARAVAGLLVLGENANDAPTAAARRSPSPETSRASR